MSPPSSPPPPPNAAVRSRRVVLDMIFSRALACWAVHGRLRARASHRRFSADETYKRHERGRDRTSEFFARLTRLTRHRGSRTRKLLEGWNAIFAGKCRSSQRCWLWRRAAAALCLPNTNRAHEAHSRRPLRWLGISGKCFCPRTIGLFGTRRVAYDHVVKGLGVPAAADVFRRRQENIEGAARPREFMPFNAPRPATSPDALARLGKFSFGVALMPVADR